MSFVRVQYTVRPEYTDTNKANIAAVMAELQELGDPGIRYAAYLMEDGQTFLHVAMFGSEESRGKLGKLESFQSFQQQLKASGLVSPPDAKPLELVGASWTVFE
jgi:hypothetical protein